MDDLLIYINYFIERFSECFNKNRNKKFINNDENLNNNFEYKLMLRSESEDKIENFGDILSRSI